VAWPGDYATRWGEAVSTEFTTPAGTVKPTAFNDTEAARGATARRVREVSGVAALLRLSRTGYVAEGAPGDRPSWRCEFRGQDTSVLSPKFDE